MSTPAQVYTIQDLRRWKDVTATLRPPARLAVIGDPVAHSASPPMQMAALAACGIEATYVRLHILPDGLAEAADLLIQHGFIGANLTIPHKAAVLPLLHQVDSLATLFGVVNTIAIRNGQLDGYNTDGPGLVRAIKTDFSANLSELRTLVLGAGGGAGRAIAIQCAIAGCRKITLVNRTLAKAEELATKIRLIAKDLHPNVEIQIDAVSSDSESLNHHSSHTDLILQCTSLGMSEGDTSPFPARLLASHHLVYDTIYSRPTQLIQDAERIGARVSTGLSLLLHQGALAFEIWFPGQDAPIDVMREALSKTVSQPVR